MVLWSNSVEIVSFDIWDTLLVRHPNQVNAQIELLGTALVGPHFNPATILSVFETVKNTLDEKTIETGLQFGFEDRLRGIHDALRPEVKEPFLTMDRIAQLRIQMGELIWANLPVLIYPETLSLFRRIRAKTSRVTGHNIEIALISNTGLVDGEFMKIALQKLGIMDLVSYTLFSNEVGLAKPSQEIYQLLVDQSLVRPENILHIGDNFEADFLGPRKIGMRSLHFAPNAGPSFERTKIRSLAEVLLFL